MSMYPSLEDMKATELIRAQVDVVIQQSQQQNYAQPQAPRNDLPYPASPYGTLSMPMPSAPPATGGGAYSSALASLTEFMGMELTEEVVRLNMPEYLPGNQQLQQGNSLMQRNNAGVAVVAPISGGNQAVVKSMITHGVRRVIISKDGSGKIGLRVRSMNTGVFACLLMDGSPAAKAGLRFGDQILQIDGQDMAGLSVEKVHKIFKNKEKKQFDLAVRDRPFERTVTLVRDSLGQVGFQFTNGRIKNIVKDSSAARNGLLTDHNLLEINGKNVIGLKDKEISKIIQGVQGNALNVTIMPSFLFDHMVKQMAGSLFGKMDHSEDF